MSGPGTPGRGRRWVAAVVAAALGLAALGGAAGALLSGDPGQALVVCTQELAVRDRPAGATLGVLRTGDLFTVQRRDGAWAYGTTAGGAPGWVLGEYLADRC